MLAMKKWILAFRLRTLPLALATVGMGGFLAVYQGTFNIEIFLLTVLTAILLQILSNLANDYGDSVHGADHQGRKGPSRAVQSGLITRDQMRSAVIIFAFLSLISGLFLLLRVFESEALMVIGWLVIGCMCIFAAITYTAGKKPYGYLGLGDLSVFLFFGIIGVIGSEYMHSKSFELIHLLPAISTGLLAVAVLNVNNIRDIDSDRAAGKFSVPVRIGRPAAARYHQFLLYAALIAAFMFVLLANQGVSPFQEPKKFLFLPFILIPRFIAINKAVANVPCEQLDPWLKKMAISAFLFILLFGGGLLLGSLS